MRLVETSITSPLLTVRGFGYCGCSSVPSFCEGNDPQYPAPLELSSLVLRGLRRGNQWRRAIFFVKFRGGKGSRDGNQFDPNSGPCRYGLGACLSSYCDRKFWNAIANYRRYRQNSLHHSRNHGCCSLAPQRFYFILSRLAARSYFGNAAIFTSCFADFLSI